MFASNEFIRIITMTDTWKQQQYFYFFTDRKQKRQARAIGKRSTYPDENSQNGTVLYSVRAIDV